MFTTVVCLIVLAVGVFIGRYIAPQRTLYLQHSAAARLEREGRQAALQELADARGELREFTEATREQSAKDAVLNITAGRSEILHQLNDTELFHLSIRQRVPAPIQDAAADILMGRQKARAIQFATNASNVMDELRQKPEADVTEADQAA